MLPPALKKAAGSARRSSPLARMPRDLAARLVEAFEQLAGDPRAAGLDVARLRGRPGYRLRLGGWRAIYRVDDDRFVVLVVDISARGDAHK
jgi:mRNA interferase RelE/StbE